MRLAYPGITLDLLYARVEHESRVEPLEPSDARVLGWLHRHADRWVPPAELLQCVWGYDPGRSPHEVQAALESLGRKLEDAPERPKILRAQPGVGYRLAPPEAQHGPLSPPTWPSSFVGRREALDQLDEATVGGAVVMLVGAAGVGKTRLVGAWAQRRRAGFVDASGCSSAAELFVRLAHAVGLDGPPDPRRIVAAVHNLGFEALVVDDVDRLGFEVDGALAALREGGLSLVVTSRRTPAVQDAQFIPLDALAMHEAIALLQSRAPETGAAETNRALVQHVRRSPLGVEIIAACLEEDDAEELAAELAEGSQEGAPGVAVAVAAAWRRLATPTRTALQQLTLFEGGFSPDGALALIDTDGPPEGHLAELIDRRLVDRDPDPRRLVVHAAVAAWLDQEEGPPPSAVRRRYAAWFARRAEAWAADLEGPGHEAARAHLAADRRNVAVAAAWALQHEARLAPPLVLALAAEAHSAGRPGPQNELQQVRAWAAHEAQPELESRANLALSVMAHLKGLGDARARFAEDAHRKAPADSEPERAAVVELARIQLAKGDLQEAELGLREVLRRPGTGGAAVEALIGLGDVHVAQRRLPQAQSAFAEAMRGAAERGMVRRWAWAGLQAAEVLAQMAALPRAVDLLGQVIDTAQGHGLSRANSLARLRRARVLSAGGARGAESRAQALADLAEAAAVAGSVGDLRQQAHALFERGALLLEDDGAAAIGPLEQAATWLEALGPSEAPAAYLARLALAQAWLDRGRTAQALRTLASLQESPLAGTEALGAVLQMVHAVALGVEGQRRSALAAAHQAEARYRAMGVMRAEVTATAVLARMSGDAQWIDKLARFPPEASPELEPLQQVVRGELPQRTDWWLVRQLSRIPAPS